MTRNLKALGLALVAVLVMSAMAAASAQAEPEFTAAETGEGGSETHKGGKIKGSALGTQIFKSTASSELALECTEASGESSTEGGTAKSLTFTNIVFSGTSAGGTCTTNPFSLPVHVFMNECDFTFNITKKIKADEYEGDVGIKCPGATKHIIVEVTKSGGGTKCTITIGEQTVGPVIYKATTESKPTVVHVESKAENVVNTTEGGLLNCGTANGEHTSGVYTGTVTAKAFAGETAVQIDAKLAGE